ncbi:hypothetical protein [Streptomyces camelliae]|uniref:Transposase n=1 Tax=Streptomyces camelliae TaxID=3004093 RepID=A0ABY7NXA2_9ACTN|nr:hypothetical protein [Streptomyces sp. HUAS 2-6]WBO61723.1 hypothetical protein O1G22_02055 [Streptomyces sp. HUAS 2-6]
MTPNAIYGYFATRADSDFQWSDCDSALLDEVRPALPGLPLPPLRSLWGTCTAW